MQVLSKPSAEKGGSKISPQNYDEFDYDPKKPYVSRRVKDFDQTDSGAEETDKDDGAIHMKDFKGNLIDMKPNMRFRNYKNIFTNLIKYRSVQTAYPLVSMMISYDSTRAITVTKKADNASILKMYSLKDYEITFHEELGNGPNDYIKCKEIE